MRAIIEAQPPVAAEHRHRLGEVVQRLALNADQGVVAALEIEPLGDVVEQVDHAAFGIGRGDDAHGAAVRQMPHVLLGLDRPVGVVERALPLAEVLLVRELARGAQPIEHGRIGRPLLEEGGVEVPERTIGGVVETKPPVGPEDRHPGGELVEGAPVRIHHALELRAHQLGLGGVDADAGAAARGRHGHHVEAAALSRDHGREPSRIGRGRFMRAQKLAAPAVLEQLGAALDRLGCVLGFDRAGIGMVDEGELAHLVARPNR